MIHHNTARKRIGFYLINTSRPRKQLGINACISSRITTVIQVVKYYQINYNWYNEPFAVSQYKLFILRHAWLNLWDKRMTTGRINQVTSPYGLNSGAERNGVRVAPQTDTSESPDPDRTVRAFGCKCFLTRSFSWQSCSNKGLPDTNRLTNEPWSGRRRGLPHSSGLLESFPNCLK